MIRRNPVLRTINEDYRRKKDGEKEFLSEILEKYYSARGLRGKMAQQAQLKRKLELLLGSKCTSDDGFKYLNIEYWQEIG